MQKVLAAAALLELEKSFNRTLATSFERIPKLDFFFVDLLRFHDESWEARKSFKRFYDNLRYVAILLNAIVSLNAQVKLEWIASNWPKDGQYWRRKENRLASERKIEFSFSIINVVRSVVCGTIFITSTEGYWKNFNVIEVENEKNALNIQLHSWPQFQLSTWFDFLFNIMQGSHSSSYSPHRHETHLKSAMGKCSHSTWSNFMNQFSSLRDATLVDKKFHSNDSR